MECERFEEGVEEGNKKNNKYLTGSLDVRVSVMYKKWAGEGGRKGKKKKTLSHHPNSESPLSDCHCTE